MTQIPTGEVLSDGVQEHSFQIKLSRTSKADASIEVEVVSGDQALLDAYNKANGTAIKDFLPEGLLTLNKKTFVVKAGKLISDDLLTIKLADLTKFASLGNKFFTALKITKVSGREITPSINHSIATITVQKDMRNLKDVADLSVLQPIAMVDLSYQTSGKDFGSSSSAFDGKPDMPWFNSTASGEDSYRISKNTPFKVRGIRLSPTSGYYGYTYPTKVQFYSLDDAGNWSSIGVATLKEDKPTDIELYAPVTTKSIKIVVLKSYNRGFSSIGDIQLYE